jgi:myb proto-oncogene protein
MLPGRIGKQCRERWHNHLRPDIKVLITSSPFYALDLYPIFLLLFHIYSFIRLQKDTWSEEEDKVLIEVHAEIGNKWAEIAKSLPGRTENSIKNHWNATKRRQYSKRKCRSKYPRGSLLQDYIKSLNLDSDTAQNGRKTSPRNTIKAPPSDDHDQPHTEEVSDYDFNEVPDFCFDGNMFQESCSIDSILDDMPCGDPVVDHDDQNHFQMDMTPVEECEVKKELDLVEMISQVNQAKCVSA